MTRNSRNDIWVFAYGSLMWRPDFEFIESEPAQLRGYHRAFCIFSHIYRGSPDNPGLVLGLDAGGSCRGRAFRLSPKTAPGILAAIDAREMIYHVYRERRLPVSLIARDGKPRVEAHTYVADRAGPQYTGKLTRARMVKLIRQGRGTSGSARDYLTNTVHHLNQLGLPDSRLQSLLQDVNAED
ncbi:MAG: gamma-glutamylcyclotransferase [Rhodospirillaceae bacterium]|nr:gamma-glutamylcyclotransferase [Rhodospirillaceae bacterium]